MGLIASRSGKLSRRLADTLSTDEDVLRTLLQTVISPFYAREATAYQVQIDRSGWRRKYCPMCGNWPGIARLDLETGRRFLYCSRCRGEWNFDRLGCPFCEQEARPELRYFVLNGSDTHRVACCQGCRGYIKIVDEQQLGRPANLFIEDMLTVHSLFCSELSSVLAGLFPELLRRYHFPLLRKAFHKAALYF